MVSGRSEPELGYSRSDYFSILLHRDTVIKLLDKWSSQREALTI